jgi:hypothetical protein
VSSKYTAKRWVKDIRKNEPDDKELNLRADLYLAARRVVELREPQHHPEFDLLADQGPTHGENCTCYICAKEQRAERTLIKIAKRLRKEQKKQRKAA